MEMYDLGDLKQLEAEIEKRTGRPVNVFTHSIEVLFELTGTRQRLQKDPKVPDVLRAYQRCNTWKPAWRYKPDDGRPDDCDTFIEAVECFGRFIDNNI